MPGYNIQSLFRVLPPGAEIKHPLYWLQKSVLILAIVWILAALFILALDVAYAELPGIAAEITGLSSVSLVGVAGAADRFFSGETSGGVTSGQGSGLRTIIGSLLGIAGYLALGGLLLVAYYALDSWFFSDLPERRPIPDGAISMTIGAFAVAAGMLFMPVRPFLNFLSLQALYRRGLRRAYILPGASQEDMLQGSEDVVSRAPDQLLLIDLKKGNIGSPRTCLITS